MEILISILTVLAGFVLLIKGADIFVEQSSKVARHFNVSELIIGLTLVAFGTSFPELAVSVTAALEGSNGIAVGNVIGSNIFNICVVAGLVSVIKPMAVSKSVVKKDMLMNLVSIIALMLLLFDINLSGSTQDILSRADGLVLLCFFSIFLYYTVFSALGNKEAEVKCDEVKEETKEKFNFPITILLIIVGLAGIVLGGNFVVSGSSSIASMFGLSDALIGLTIVSVGTSLPEFVTSLVAVLKGKNDIAIGNVIGSNLFNTLLVLGVSASITPIVMTTSLFVDIIVLIAVSIALIIFSLKTYKINKFEGFIMFMTYVVYMVYIIVRDLGISL